MTLVFSVFATSFCFLDFLRVKILSELVKIREIRVISFLSVSLPFFLRVSFRFTHFHNSTYYHAAIQKR